MRPIDLPVTANVPELILLRTWAASKQMPCIRVLGMIGSGNEALNIVRANILAQLFCQKQIGKSFDRLLIGRLTVSAHAYGEPGVQTQVTCYAEQPRSQQVRFCCWHEQCKALIKTPGRGTAPACGGSGVGRPGTPLQTGTAAATGEASPETPPRMTMTKLPPLHLHR